MPSLSLPPADCRHIAIVGNAPDATDRAARIDAAPWVVRFNNAHGFGTATGSRVDDLYLVNCGGQALEWLTEATFWDAPHIRQAQQITLPWRAPSEEEALPRARHATGAAVDGLNFEWDMRARLTRAGLAVHTLGPAEVAAARAIVGGDAPPSTGFLAIHHYCQACPAQIHLYGFGFDGWDGHAWARERAWVEGQIADGKLVYHAPNGDEG